MGEKNSKLTSIFSTKSIGTAAGRIDGQPNRRRIMQNYLLVWLDANVTTSNEDTQHTLQQLRSVVNDVNLFMEPNQCVTFLDGIQLEKVFLIISGSLGRDLVPRIHDMAQIDAIYIFCADKSRHVEWVKKWPKVKGIFIHIQPICAALELAAKQCNQDSTAVSFLPVSGEGALDIKHNQLEPSFMYTQLFKNTLLNMEHDRKKEVRDLVNYCKETYAGNSAQLKLIKEFSRDYDQGQAIWWYTREGFTYQMLNRSLRLLEAEVIVNMGFLIYDLHQQIKQLHKEQGGLFGEKSFIVYRGQGMSISAFEKLQTSHGGLISFNCFLSTSMKKEVSLPFAEKAAMANEKVGILFVMTIDPKISATPFADIHSSSYFKNEVEILFSMHTVFRIGAIRSMDGERRLFEVNLSLTTDDDVQLRTLTDQLDTEVQTLDGWERMGRLLIEVGQPHKAEELYCILLEQSSDQGDQGRYYHHLGCIKDQQADYKEALHYYERALEIKEKSLPANHFDLATSYNNIGSVYMNLGDYSKALSFYERALEIREKSVLGQHPSLAISYNNVGSVYDSMGEYWKALSFYERALEIRQRRLPDNHPSLASSYNNIGLVYKNMGEYSKALSSHEQALQIQQKSLPENHPSLAISYSNIGSVYYSMGEHSKALSLYEKDLKLSKKILPDDHPALASSYNNIGLVHHSMGENSKALSFYERALEIRQKKLPVNHPDLATSYSNIASVYGSIGKYPKALSFYERALEIRQKSLPVNHPDLATTYHNMGGLHNNLGENAKALFFYQRALEIRQRSLPENHPSLAISYNNVGSVYDSMGEYPKALSFYERALEIRQKRLPASHPHVLDVQNSIEVLKIKLNKK